MFGTFNYSNIEAMDKVNIDGLHIEHYPLYFDHDTCTRVLKFLSTINFMPTYYREADGKIQMCTNGVEWYTDYNFHKSARDWAYAVCEDHINGIRAKELSGVLFELRDLVTKFTGKPYNSVVIRRSVADDTRVGMWNNNEDPWLGNHYDTPCMSFGGTRALEFRKRLEFVPPFEPTSATADKELKQKNQKLTQRSFSLYNGSLFIMKDPTQKMWQHRFSNTSDSPTSYHIIFRYVKPDLIHKQYQKYPIVELVDSMDLTKQWRTDQNIIDSSNSKSEFESDSFLTNIGKMIGLRLPGSPIQIQKPDNVLRNPILTPNDIMEPKSKPRLQLQPQPQPQPKKVITIEEQLSMMSSQPHSQPQPEITVEELEKKIKQETGKDIHIDYKNRNRNRNRNKTVVVDLTQLPTTPTQLLSVNYTDRKNVIRRLYYQLLPIKEINYNLFDRRMREISDRIKSITDKETLITEETAILNQISQYRRNAIESLQTKGLISEAESTDLYN